MKRKQVPEVKTLANLRGQRSGRTIKVTCSWLGNLGRNARPPPFHHSTRVQQVRTCQDIYLPRKPPLLLGGIIATSKQGTSGNAALHTIDLSHAIILTTPSIEKHPWSPTNSKFQDAQRRQVHEINSRDSVSQDPFQNLPRPSLPSKHNIFLCLTAFSHCGVFPQTAGIPEMRSTPSFYPRLSVVLQA